MTNQVDLTAAVEGHDGIFVVRGGGNCRDWNNIQYQVGLSGKNVGARQLSMNVATIPPGGVAFAHIHVNFEVMLYILEGAVRHEYGPSLEHTVDNGAGDFISAVVHRVLEGRPVLMPHRPFEDIEHDFEVHVDMRKRDPAGGNRCHIH